MRTFELLLALLLISSVYCQTVIYVNQALGDDINNSGNETSPFATIQRALQNYAQNTTILIGEGTQTFSKYLTLKKEPMR